MKLRHLMLATIIGSSLFALLGWCILMGACGSLYASARGVGRREQERPTVH